jgi:hypothetical protein
MSHRPKQPDRHGRNSLGNYIAVHESCMSDLYEYFVESNTLKFEIVSKRTLRLHGSVYCHGGLVFHVTKDLELNGENQVKTFSY